MLLWETQKVRLEKIQATVCVVEGIAYARDVYIDFDSLWGKHEDSVADRSENEAESDATSGLEVLGEFLTGKIQQGGVGFPAGQARRPACLRATYTKRSRFS